LHLQSVALSNNIKVYWSSNLNIFQQRASGGVN